MPGSSTSDLRTEMHSFVTTERGMFTVSSENNVIVFVLDNYDTEHLLKAVTAVAAEHLSQNAILLMLVPMALFPRVSLHLTSCMLGITQNAE